MNQIERSIGTVEAWLTIQASVTTQELTENAGKVSLTDNAYCYYAGFAAAHGDKNKAKYWVDLYYAFKDSTGRKPFTSPDHNPDYQYKICCGIGCDKFKLRDEFLELKKSLDKANNSLKLFKKQCEKILAEPDELEYIENVNKLIQLINKQ